MVENRGRRITVGGGTGEGVEMPFSGPAVVEGTGSAEGNGGNEGGGGGTPALSTMAAEKKASAN
jgi:hypothetical protein